jgi:hypothetical protein
MSAEFAIALALLIFASNYACYRLGQMNILARYERYAKRRREREARWAEFDDED